MDACVFIAYLNNYYNSYFFSPKKFTFLSRHQTSEAAWGAWCGDWCADQRGRSGHSSHTRACSRMFHNIINAHLPLKRYEGEGVCYLSMRDAKWIAWCGDWP